MRYARVLVTVVLAAAAVNVAASPFDYRFGLWGGAFSANVDTTMRWDSSVLEGTRIGLESDLGMKDNDTSFNGELEWRFWRRNALKLRFFELKRNGDATAPFDIIIDGENIPLDSNIRSSFNSQVTALSYEFTVIKRENLMFGVGLGLSVQDLEFGIAADDADVSKAGNVTAPLPTVNAGIDWAISPKWIVNADIGWFDLKVDNVKGEVSEFRAGVTWKAWENVGLNLSYNYFKVMGKVTEEEGEFEGSLQYEFKGPLIGVVATF